MKSNDVIIIHNFFVDRRWLNKSAAMTHELFNWEIVIREKEKYRNFFSRELKFRGSTQIVLTFSTLESCSNFIY